MAKLHELLAVEPNLRSQAETCRADLKNTFEKKTHHFEKKIVTFKPNADGAPDKVESQLALQTSVTKELTWISAMLAKTIDAGHRIDTANLSARADVVLDDGTVLLTAVPGTSLLRLEHRLLELRDLIQAIPTLDPAKGFTPDTTEASDGSVFRARDKEGVRTEKKFEFVVMVPPTDKHPAQVKELIADRPIGTLVTQEWSSLVTVATKGDMLDRCEGLLRAVKKARSRAADIDVDVKANAIADTLLSHVLGIKLGAAS
jgi:hypothetical protein